jgi:hypothetical protein
VRWAAEAAGRLAGGRRPRAFAFDGSGAAFLEFALVLPVLLIVFAGIVELGRALSAYGALERGARAGARALARAPDPSCDPGCSPGAARAVEFARRAIAAETGLPPAAVRVRPDPAPPAGAVVMRAELDLPTVFGGAPGLPQSWRLSAAPEEPRLAE